MKFKYRNVFLLMLLISLFSIFVEQTRSDSVWEDGKFEAPLRDLETIRKEGHLRVVVDYNSISYFVYRGKPMGYKYELLRELARELDVELDFYVNNDVESTFFGLETGRYDLAAKNLTVTGERSRRVDFTQPLEQTRQVLVQRKSGIPGEEKEIAIRNVLDLSGKRVVVQQSSAFYERLKNLKEETGGKLVIVEDSISDTEHLVEKVSTGEIELTVCDESMIKLYQRQYPGLDFSVPVSFRQNIAWAVRKDAVNLREYIDSWLTEFQGTYRYQAIRNHYYKTERKQYRMSLLHATGSRISEYDELVKSEAKAKGMDWRLISAVMYKESSFDPLAISFAGASGLMQLMPETAESMGVEDIFDPEQNIKAGVALLSWLNDQFLQEIPDERERLKFVLASYNVGLGHVRDSQRLAEKYGRNPLVWNDHVEFFLLNKSEVKYYSDEVVRWGYCNGSEPYHFVQAVLGNYDNFLASVSS
jgi:membrane-bound lytic murein transglycosylase F